MPAVTAEHMQEVDRIAVEEFGLGILQMMENAGRNLSGNVIEMLGESRGEVTVLAGSGGNGGGGSTPCNCWTNVGSWTIRPRSRP